MNITSQSTYNCLHINKVHNYQTCTPPNFTTLAGNKLHTHTAITTTHETIANALADEKTSIFGPTGCCESLRQGMAQWPQI